MGVGSGGRYRRPARIRRSLPTSVTEAARLRRSGQPERARAVLTRTLRTARAGTRADALVARLMLAEVLVDLGDLSGAYREIRPAAEQIGSVLGDGHPATTRALAVLATVLHERGDLEAAGHLYRQVATLAPDVAGPSGRTASLVRVRLALLHHDQGRFGAAREELAAAYAAHRRAFGPADPDTVRIAARLAEMPAPALPVPLPAPSPVPSPVPLPVQLPAGRTRRRQMSQAVAAAAVAVGCLTLYAAGGPPVAKPLLDVPIGTATQPAPAAPVGPGPAVAPDITVSIRDEGASATVSWRLGAPAAVVLATTDAAGNLREVVTTVPAAQTSYVLRGLDPSRNFCVVVGPVDSAAAVTRTATACTTRQ